MLKSDSMKGTSDKFKLDSVTQLTTLCLSLHCGQLAKYFMSTISLWYLFGMYSYPCLIPLERNIFGMVICHPVLLKL